MVGALQFEVLMAIVGTEKFSSAIGLVLLMEAIAVLVGPPSAGQYALKLRNNTNVGLDTSNSFLRTMLCTAVVLNVGSRNTHGSSRGFLRGFHFIFLCMFCM